MGLYRWIILFLAGLGATVPLRRWVVEPIYVASASMEPALPVGARLLSDKVTLRLRPPRRGDIVLFSPPSGAALGAGKRVIALPRETVELRGDEVYVDGKPLDEPYAVHRRPGTRRPALGPLTVPPGGLFLLGDNRDESEDSSVWKDSTGSPVYFVPVASVTGLVRPLF